MRKGRDAGVRLRCWGLALAAGVGVAVPRALAAQGSDSTAAAVAPAPEPALGPPAAVLDAAAQTITSAELARHLSALAAESLRGRATSRAALEVTARYVAAQFQQLGLQPEAPGLGGGAQWLKRYPLPGARRPFHPVASELRVAARLRRAGQAADALDELGRSVERVAPLDFATTARLAAVDSLAELALTRYRQPLAGTHEQSAPVLVVSGRHTAATLPCDRDGAQNWEWDPAERPLLLYVPPAGLDSAAQAAVLAGLTRCGPVLVVAADDADSGTFAARQTQATATEMTAAIFDRYVAEAVGARAWAIYAAPRIVAPVLQTAGLDLAATWADSTPRVRALPPLRVTASLFFLPPPEPDTLGWVYVTAALIGTDSLQLRQGQPSLAESYVVYSAALDGSGTSASSAGAASGMAPEADTEGSVAGLLALAKAFTQPGARPRRSVLFLLTSGARQHAAPSRLIGHMLDERSSLNLTLEQLGRGSGDTLAIAGLSEFRFARPPAWLANAHPELGLTVVDGGTMLRPGSQAYAFAHHGWVSLALAPTPAGAGATGAAGAAVVGAVEVARLTPAVRFAFYLGQELANARTRPQWTPEARGAWLRGLGR